MLKARQQSKQMEKHIYKPGDEVRALSNGMYISITIGAKYIVTSFIAKNGFMKKDEIYIISDNGTEVVMFPEEVEPWTKEPAYLDLTDPANSHVTLNNQDALDESTIERIWLNVKAALGKAAEVAKYGVTFEHDVYIDKDSILNAFKKEDIV